MMAESVLIVGCVQAHDPDFGSMTEEQQLQFALSMSMGAGMTTQAVLRARLAHIRWRWL
jgi:hypothetical protein